ncbi:hypothetical protein KI387_005490, partial [Taxus chinensis]
RPEKLKASRPLRNNVNLRQELQDFISEVGLPYDSVPSFKELSLHGRQDLANIVRRRGYKAITQLLAEPEITHTTKSTEKKTTLRDGAVSLKELKEPDTSSSMQSFNVPPHDNNGRTDGSGYFREQNSNLHIQYSQNTWLSSECPFGIYGADTVHMVESKSDYTLKSSSYMSLRERAADFVRTGDFHDTEGEGDSEEHEGDEEPDKNGYKAYKRDDALPLNPYAMDAEKSLDAPSESDSGIPSISGRSAVTKAAYASYFWSDYPLTDTLAAKKTSFWTSEVQPFSREEASNPFHRNINDQLHFNDDRISESAVTKQMLMELEHLNSLLRSKESELSKLKQELVKEKERLYSIQEKAMAEVACEKQILSEKESELIAADQALSDLKQVRIEYWGKGINVEVTGSFNGWQHHISMEPDMASEIKISDGTRSSSLLMGIGNLTLDE